MMHEEVPEHPGVPCHGLQMFVNLKDEHKRAAPVAYHASRAKVPEVRPSQGARVRVLVGTFGGEASPLSALLTPVTFLEVHLAPGAAVEVDAPHEHSAFAMTIRGAGDIADVAVSEHEAVLFARDGDLVRFEAGARGLQLLFGEGAPLGEPVVFGGPFAMTRLEDIRDAQARFARGEMGSLTPSSRY
jgi:redox-sensitive bicupin YhaK (pirin superfamily)